MYTTPLSSLVTSTSTDHHLFADDTQLFCFFSPKSFSETINHLQSTFLSVSDWMTDNFLALNPSKTEFIIFGTQTQLSKLSDPTFTISPDVSIKPVCSVRNLGIFFDSHLSFHDQITKLSQACFFHIRDLRRIRPCLSLDTATKIGTALVQSKLDYCNSLYLNLPAYELDRLQFLQNSLARAIYRSSKFSHVTPHLMSLHWLKIRERILYKTISLTYKCIETSDPKYITDLITIQELGSIRSSKLVTLKRPPNPS